MKNIKEHNNEPENTYDSSFAHTLFKYLKRAYLQILKDLKQFFASFFSK